MATSPVRNHPSSVKASGPFPVEIAVDDPGPADAEVAHRCSVGRYLVPGIVADADLDARQGQPGLSPGRVGDPRLVQSRMRSWGHAIEASGDVSVMPQAWTIRIPNSAA